MDKTLRIKNVYFTRKEELHLANMIVGGAKYDEINEWHLTNFGKPMARSKYFRFKNKALEIISNDNKKISKVKYNRPGESDLVQFEEHLKEEITVRTNNPVIKWTYELLTTLANNEREKEPYCKMDILKQYKFTNRYWMKYMDRNQLVFSSRKSDQKNFSEKEIVGFRSIMNAKLMFYPKDCIINLDESAVFFNEIRGRIVVEKGNSEK